MKEMWAASAREGAIVLAIPPLPSGYKSGEPTRRDLAQKVRQWVSDRNRAGDRSVVLLDLEDEFDLDGKMPASQRQLVFDSDGLHLTEYGYTQYLSGLVYDALVKEAGL